MQQEWKEYHNQRGRCRLVTFVNVPPAVNFSEAFVLLNYIGWAQQTNARASSHPVCEIGIPSAYLQSVLTAIGFKITGSRHDLVVVETGRQHSHCDQTR